jgi:hypothetical protein
MARLPVAGCVGGCSGRRAHSPGRPRRSARFTAFRAFVHDAPGGMPDGGGAYDGGADRCGSSPRSGDVPNPNTGNAPARPALGFQLDTTTLADVHAWASQAHVDCSDIREGVVKCTEVSPSALSRASEGRIDELVFAFNPQSHLVNVTALRSHLKPMPPHVPRRRSRLPSPTSSVPQRSMAASSQAASRAPGRRASESCPTASAIASRMSPR